MSTIIRGSGDTTFGGTIQSTGIDDNATSTAITIDASENVGLGVVPKSSVSTHTNLQVGNTGYISLRDKANDAMYVAQNIYHNASDVESYIETGYASSYFMQSGKHTFNVAPSGTADTAISWTTAMNIKNDGRVVAQDDLTVWGSNYTGSTVSGGFGTAVDIYFAGGGAEYGMEFWPQADGTSSIVFRNAGGSTVGGVYTTASSTSFNTSSDYRLKENVVPMTGSIDRLKDLKPSRFNFKTDTDTTVDGFIAHEAQTVVPECASGEKDAMRDEEYEVTPAVMDGDTVVTEAVMGTRSVPDYQGIDQSKLVPLLVASLQEAIARIEQLENA